jgi:hypothetical protein
MLSNGTPLFLASSFASLNEEHSSNFSLLVHEKKEEKSKKKYIRNLIFICINTMEH